MILLAVKVFLYRFFLHKVNITSLRDMFVCTHNTYSLTYINVCLKSINIHDSSLLTLCEFCDLTLLTFFKYVGLCTTHNNQLCELALSLHFLYGSHISLHIQVSMSMNFSACNINRFEACLRHKLYVR